MADVIQDNEAVYDSEIAPLMDTIIAICQKAKIPMLASFQLTSDVDDEEGALLCTTALIPSDDTVGLAANLRPACDILHKQSHITGMIISKLK